MEHKMNDIMSVVRQVGLQAQPQQGIPLIEIYGQNRVLIENHMGVCGYSCEEIRINVKRGCIFVSGQNLKLSKMNREKMVITGNVYAVKLQGSA